MRYSFTSDVTELASVVEPLPLSLLLVSPWASVTSPTLAISSPTISKPSGQFADICALASCIALSRSPFSASTPPVLSRFTISACPMQPTSPRVATAATAHALFISLLHRSSFETSPQPGTGYLEPLSLSTVLVEEKRRGPRPEPELPRTFLYPGAPPRGSIALPRLLSPRLRH